MCREAAIAAALGLTLCASACGPADLDRADAGDTDASSVEPVCTAPSAIACEDQLYLQLSYQTTVSPRGVVSTQTGSSFIAMVDATAGGMNESSRNPFVYLRFTDSGMEQVEISDEQALSSMEWHLSARRFIVLVNSGDAGPSCVGAFKVDGSFGALTEAPNNASYAMEDFFDERCQYLSDPRFEGFDSPDSVLKDWWLFDNCVATTGQLYVLRLGDGRLVKMVIDSYYAEDQDDCNTLGVAGAGSAFITIRWAWL